MKTKKNLTENFIFMSGQSVMADSGLQQRKGLKKLAQKVTHSLVFIITVIPLTWFVA